MTARVLFLLLALSGVACSPGIGDSCNTNADCGSDRTCDLSQPEGYCTRTNCTRIGCPGDAVCIEYQSQVSYCMQRCGPFEFCRSGYVCVEDVAMPDGGTYPGFCNQVASSPDAITPADVLPGAGDALSGG